MIIGSTDCAIKDAPSSILNSGTASIPVPPCSVTEIAVGLNADTPRQTPHTLGIAPTDSGNQVYSLLPAIVDNLTSNRAPRNRRPNTRYDPDIYNSHNQPSKRKQNNNEDNKNSNLNQLPVASAANENK
jgi:hypothetical protein